MSNPTNGMAPRPNIQDLMRLIPAELQNASGEEKMAYLKTLVTRSNANQAVGSPQMRPSPRPRPPSDFNNAQGMPKMTAGANMTPNSASGTGPQQAALIQRLCAQAGITVQHFHTLTQPQQQAFIASQAAIMRQSNNRAQAPNGGTPGQTSSPGMIGRPLAAGLQQQSNQGSPAVPGLNINGAPGQTAGGIQNSAQVAAIAAAAAAGNPALQARLLQMRAQGQPMTQALQNQLAAVAAAQNKNQPNAQGVAGMMNQAGQPGVNQLNNMMAGQSPRPPSEGLPGVPGGPQGNAPGTPGSQNGQSPANQKQYQEIHNILSNLPEFMKMKEENRLNEQQKKMLDYIVKMKGPGTYGNLLNQQTANTQPMQAQRQQQPQRQQSTGLPGQENLSLHSNQQHALFRQLQNMQQQQQQMTQSGSVDQGQVPGTPNQSNMMSTPRPGSLPVNGMQSAGTPNSQGTSSPVAMGTPSGSATSAVTAAMAFKKIEDMSDEKRNQFFRNTPPIRRSYFTHIRGMPEETRRELFTRKPAIKAAYQEYVQEMNLQQLRAAQARQSPLNANAAGDMGTPDMKTQLPTGADLSGIGPLPNLQLPPNRQRLLSQAQARQGPGGPAGPAGVPNGIPPAGQMPMMGMNPQMQQAQNQAAAAAATQMAAFKTQSQAQMMQNPPSLPHGITQSPHSMHGTPQMAQNAALPSNLRAGTPNRVASLAANGMPSRQGSMAGSPQLNSSPGMANANVMPGMPMQNNGAMGLPGQQMGQQQLQAQFAQIGQLAQAQLQANLQSQAMGQPIMPMGVTGGPVAGRGMPQPGMIPPPIGMGGQPGSHSGLPPAIPGQMNQIQAAQMQMQGRGRPMGFPLPNGGPQAAQECPPVSAEIQISQVLPASAKTFPFVTKYPDTKPLRPSLNGGLAAGMTLGLPPYLHRPASIGRYMTQLQRDIMSSGAQKLAMKGTIFEKLNSNVKEGDEVEEETATPAAAEVAVKGEKAVTTAVAEEDLAESSGSSTGKRKLADLANCLYPDVNITEAAEDVLLEIGDEFIDSCIEFGCRMARHRKARKLEVQDIQFHLGREYNINIPGFSSDAIRMDRLRNELKIAATNGAGPAGGTRAQRLAALGQARVQMQQQAKKAMAATAAARLAGPVGENAALTVPPVTKLSIKS
ncbi:hypothetical protein NliqN6_4031 [Naganishia liquefaciens]|uniref:Transcription initiation factor TFIID subunit 12 domain-containing protein n=1 Tax=Naganishia liquefaciens TaxID=104408 RepID=A0A8H3TV35_9TREE|nr:hypothetical protein NliqN6_4031 [Naganishia liquefaciens]